MKILFVTNHLNGTDGWSRYSVDLIKELKKLGHEPECLVWKKNKFPVKQYGFLENPMKYLVNPFKLLSGARKLKKIIKETKPDVVHFIVEPYSQMLFFMRSDYSVKYFLTAHGTYSFIPNLLNGFKKQISKIFAKNIFKRINNVICVSSYTRKFLLKSLKSSGISSEKIEAKLVVVKNGVKISESKVVKKDKLKGHHRILFVGAVKARKGLAEAIRSLAIFRNKYSSNFVFEIVGDDSDRVYIEYLNSLASELKISEDIVFRGRVNERELNELYANADLYLMLSIHSENQFEGFGLVYLEANSYGVPCIGSLQSGAVDAILDGKTGFLVNPKNYSEVADKINMVLRGSGISPEKCKDWAYENRIEKKVQKIMCLYEK